MIAQGQSKRVSGQLSDARASVVLSQMFIDHFFYAFQIFSVHLCDVLNIAVANSAEKCHQDQGYMAYAQNVKFL